MSASSPAGHAVLYWTVGAVLFALTGTTVLVSRLGLPDPWGTGAGVAIAVLKAALVAAVYMHLVWESRFVYYVLCAAAFTALFLSGFAIADALSTTGNLLVRAGVDSVPAGAIMEP